MHAFICLGWIGLVMVQAYCATAGKVTLHVKIGLWGMAYGVVLIVSGLSMALYLFARDVAAEGVDSRRIPLLAATTDMAVFSAFLCGAWITRRRPELHRRFILLAANALIIAGASRLFGGTSSLRRATSCRCWPSGSHRYGSRC